MNAAKIIMLRIAPHSMKDPQYQHIQRKAATDGGGEGCHFDEKDEGRVNGGFAGAASKPASTPRRAIDQVAVPSVQVSGVERTTFK